MARGGGRSRVYLEGDASGVTKAARQAETALKRLDRAGSRSLGGLSKTAKGLNPHLAGAIAGFTSLAGAAALLKDSVKTTEDLAKGTAMISRTTGESTQEASRWVAVAKVRGLEVTRLNRSFVGLAKAIEGANAGSKKQTELFKELGISQKELAKGDVSQILGDISDAFAKMPDGAKKAADAQQLFGRGAASILPLLNRGNAALREQLGLSDKYGTTLTKGQLAASLKAAQAQRELNLAMMGLKVQLGQAVIPALTVGITKFTAFVAQMRSGEGAGGKFAAKLREVWQNVKPTVVAIGQLASNVGKFVATHPAAQKLLAVLIPMGAALKVMGGTSGIVGRLATSLFRVGASAGAGGGGAAAGFAVLAASYQHLKSTGYFEQHSKQGKIGAALETTKHSVYSLAEAYLDKLIPGSRKYLDVLSPMPKLIEKVGAKLKDQLGTVTQYGQSWSSVADQIKRFGDTYNNLPSLSLPSAPAGPGARTSRRGGFVFQRGGTVPALVSSGEVIVEPGGGVWQAPGAPVAADNVPAMLRPGSAVLTWDGQARMAAGASLGQAVAMQAPHFRSGGYATWTKVGASVYGGTPGDDNGVGSVGSNLWRKGAYPFAELGWGHSLGGLRDYQKLYIRRGNRAVVGTNEDVGPSYGDRKIDLHKQIAVALGISPTSFLGPVQIMNAPSSAKPGPVDPRTLTSTGSTSGGTPARTVTRTSYAAPSPGTGRSSRSAFDAGFESGMSDPFGLVRSQDRSDYYNSTKRGLFGTWSKTTRTIPGTKAAPTAGTPKPGDRSFYKRVASMRGLGKWNGWTVANWIIPELQWARAHGWTGNITSGYRSHAYNVSRGRYYHSRHEDTGPYPYGAIDFGSPSDASGKLNFLRYVKGYPGPQLHSLPGDAGHMSGDGHRRGGWVRRFRGGGMVSRVRGGHSQLLPTVSKVAGGFSGDTTPTRNAAYSTLWRLIGLGYGKQDEPAVKSTYARMLRLVDRLGYDDLRGLAADVKSIYRRQFGSTPRARTIRARLQAVLGTPDGKAGIDAAIGRSIGRPVGVADSVEADITDQGGQLADKLTLGGVDPDSKEGIDATIDFNNRSITRLWRRRAALKDALARAKRAKRPDVAKRITDEIKDVDSQVTAMAAANVRLRRSRISAPTNAESQAGATGGGDNPDLQAQLDQANVRATVAQRTAGLSEAFIRTAFGSGDIGRGGSYAWTAAGGSGAAFGPGMSITINTLHPGDSQTLAAIADAATAGMGQQGFVTSPRAVSGA